MRSNDQQKIDLGKVLGGGPPFYSRAGSMMHSFYLYEIGDPEDYTDWLDTIRNCSENDVVKIHINSNGGNLLTTLQIIRALQETAATIICSVEGQCMSAATIIFLQADIIEVSEHSMFMFHNYSGGTFGKGGEMMDQLKYEAEWSESMFRDFYREFLTEEELQLMFNNKDIWLNGDEVTERVRLKAEALQLRLQEEEEALQPKPKRRRRKASESKE